MKSKSIIISSIILALCLISLKSYSAVLSIITSGAEDAGMATEVVTNNVASTANTALETTDSTAAEVISTATTSGEDSTGEAPPIVDNAIPEIIDTIDNSSSQIIDTVDNTSSETVDVIVDTAVDASNTVDDLTSDTIDSVDNATEEVENIANNLPVSLIDIEILASEYRDDSHLQYQNAVNVAQVNNWLIKSQGVEIKYLTEAGIPIYNGTTSRKNNHRNLQEANLSGTNLMWNNYTGKGLSIGLWDTGSVDEDHSEYDGRIIWKDEDEMIVDPHPTHVAGTLVASGNNNLEAKGMAPEATIHAFNWNNNASEIIASAAKYATSDGLLISNHSYGTLTGWSYHASGLPEYPHIKWVWNGVDCDEFEFCHPEQDYKNGLYTKDAFDLDYASYILPYHLIVKSAGNNVNEGPPSGTSHIAWKYDGTWTQVESSKTRTTDCANKDGFDCLMPDSTAKNILTVGAVGSDEKIATYSSKGPTDDGRIKPDIVAKGDNVISTWTNDAYEDLSGTSMSTPVLSGSLLLLQEKYKSLNNNKAMRAATLKALAIHSADDIQPAGPDFSTGWGALNTKRASSLLDKNDSTHQILQLGLNNGEKYTLDFVAKSSKPIVATIVWTDYPEKIHPDALDPSDIVLTNDLDLRIINNDITFYPWKMNLDDPAKGAGIGDNIRDNVEQVVIYNPIIGETYQIVVNHKDQLKTDTLLYGEACYDSSSQSAKQNNIHQCFSLIVSQLDSGIIFDDKLNIAKAELNSSGNLSLYLPAVNFGQQTFSANMEVITSSAPIQFVMKSFNLSDRKSTLSSAVVDEKSLDISIPQVSYDNKLWKLNLSNDANVNVLKWTLKDASVVQ